MSRRRRPAEQSNHERWLVSYADFITLLFAFFTTLYAISTVDQKKADRLVSSMRDALGATQVKTPPAASAPPPGSLIDNAGGGPEPAPVTRLDLLQQAAQEIAALPELNGKVKVRRERGGVVVSLSEAGFFESGKATLQSGALAALQLFARRIADQKDVDVIVEGHTDDVPVRNERFKSNWELSTVRATFVVSVFLEVPGFTPSRIGAAGYAENRPVASNETASGRARNRRVDVVLRPVLAEGPSSSPTATASASPSMQPR